MNIYRWIPCLGFTDKLPKGFEKHVTIAWGQRQNNTQSMDLATILICSLPKVAINVHLCHCLGGYVYIKYDKNITRVITESPNTGASKKLHITCRHAGHLFKFKHMSRGSFSCHILPTYIVVRRSVAYVVSPSQWVYSIEMDTLSRL